MEVIVSSVGEAPAGSYFGSNTLVRNINGHNVSIRGVMDSDGIFKIGTAWVTLP